MVIFSLVSKMCGPVAEWLGRGLQILVQRFDSAPDLILFLPGWWNGIHEGLKIPWEQSLVSSSLTPGTFLCLKKTEKKLF